MLASRVASMRSPWAHHCHRESITNRSRWQPQPHCTWSSRASRRRHGSTAAGCVGKEAQSSRGASSSSSGSTGDSPARSAAAASPGRVVRHACKADLQYLHKIERLTSGPDSWSQDQIAAELDRERATALVVEEGGSPIAFVVGWAVAGELHIITLNTHPRWQRRGHARALLTALLDLHEDAGEAQLEVRVSNAAALSLYESMGFERVGLRKAYYQDGESAILMTKKREAHQRRLDAGE